MSDFLNFILAVVIILVAAKASGYLSVRLGQPSILGELFAGLILGPTVLDLFVSLPWITADQHLADSITLIAELGVLLLMFLAGLELELPELLRSGHVSAVAGALGVVVPLLGGFLTARLFGLGTPEAIFVGLSLSATSVSISAQTLMELNVLRSKVGLTLLGAAVFDDVLVVFLLSAASVIFGVGIADVSVAGVLVRMLLFLVLATAAGILLVPPLLRRITKLPISQGITVFALVTCLLFAWASEALGGIAAITGAFMAGLFLARTSQAGRIEQSISAMAYGFFVPVFLVNIGLQANLREVSGSLWIFAVGLTVVAILSKVIGSGGGAYLVGFSRRDSLRLGIGMISRGEVGLIVASVALSQGLMRQDTFSVVVFMIIIATFVTPLLLRWAYREEKGEEDARDLDDPLPQSDFS